MEFLKVSVEVGVFKIVVEEDAWQFYVAVVTVLECVVFSNTDAVSVFPVCVRNERVPSCERDVVCPLGFLNCFGFAG